MIPSGGGIPRRLGESLPNVIAPVWSPDSKSILIFGCEAMTPISYRLVDRGFGLGGAEQDGDFRRTTIAQAGPCNRQPR